MADEINYDSKYGVLYYFSKIYLNFPSGEKYLKNK